MSASPSPDSHDSAKSQTSLSSFGHTSESLEYIATHVFFPFQPPDADDYTPEKSHSLARAVCTAAHAYSTHICGTSEQNHWNRITKMLDNLQASVQSQDIDRDHAISQLQGMQTGDILVFFIRRQNAAIILTKRENSTLWEAFEVSPSEDAVSEAEGPLRLSYPCSAAEIPNKAVDDRDFQFQFAKFPSHPNIDWDFPLPPPAHPQYIDILLNTILESIGLATSTAPITNSGAVPKRIRDRVGRSWKLEDEGKDVWRRSPLWLLIRVAIQTSVHASFGSASYKRFILFFMCTLASDAKNASLSTNIISLMSSRILGRLKKLGSPTSDWLVDMALKTCTRLREILDTRWKEPSIRRSPFQNPTQDELARDMQLSLLNSREYIEHVLENSGHEPVGPFHPSHRPRGTIDDFLSTNGTFFDEAYEADPDITLYDVERSVELGIDDWVAHITDVDDACAQLGFLLDKYLMKAYHHELRYNPEETSLKLLTAMELYVALDKLVVRAIPMLADYPPGISTAFLEKILLRKGTSLHRLSCAYQYLSARHAQSRPGWSVISDDFTEDSFPVRYYDQSLHLQQLKARIEEDADKGIARGVSVRAGHNHLTSIISQGKQEHPGMAQQSLVDSIRVSRSPLPASLPHAKVVVFELQCPTCLRIWRSAAPCILNGSFLLTAFPRRVDPEDGDHLLENVRALQPYFVIGHQGPVLHVQIHLAYFYPEDSCSPTIRYVARHPYWKDPYRGMLSIPGQIRQAGRYCRNLELSLDLGYSRFGYGPDILKKYMDSISHTCNHVLATQAECPPALSVDEFVAFAHLRSGGSLQWLNILRGLRCRTLNFRRDEVHFVLAHAACQVGPLDPNTGTWVWHQELQDPSFCDVILDELERLFVDVGAGSIDAVLMNTISLLITRVLASSPGEDISDRAITILRRVRRKSFGWAQELLYDLSKAPTNRDRINFLLHMAAACRSTFDIDPAALRTLFRSAEDVDALLSCAIFIHAVRTKYSNYPPENYLTLWQQRDFRLSFTLEETLKDVILADPSNWGVDLAVGRIFVSYTPGIQRSAQLEYPDARWLTCQTKATKDQCSQMIHINLLNGALHVDGRSLNGSLREIWRYPEVFCNQGFLVVSSSLPGMDFTTLDHKVHFSLRGDLLVLRIQDNETNEILELIPSTKLRGDLPSPLVDRHVHWLNLSTKIIEIRPLKELWKQSTEHWRIDCTLGRYNMSQGGKALVDIRSPTWAMILKCFECLNNVEESDLESWTPLNKEFKDHLAWWNLSEEFLITTSLVQSGLPPSQLSVTLSGYGLSFFVNDGGELESRDFKNMVYDEDQYIGTLFGLENFLTLRPNIRIAGTLVPEALFHRQVLIPNGYPELHDDSSRVRIDILHRDNWRYSGTDQPLYYTYDVDTELGCLLGYGSFASTLFLASLHAMTNCHQPDPLTGKTGVQTALWLLQSAVCRSIMKQKVDAAFFQIIRTKDPQVNSALKDIQTRYYWDRDMYRLSTAGDQDKQAAHTFAPNATPSRPSSPKDQHCGEILHSAMHDPDPAQLVFPLAVSSLQHIFNAGPPIMTLDHLICNRPAPDLPARITLHVDTLEPSTNNSDATPRLDRLFSSLPTDSSFKREYLAHLDTSAQHARVHSRITHKAVGENPTEKLKEHHVQCRVNYLHCLDILRGNLGPTNSHEQTLDRTGQWPRITADGLLRYLASTCPIKVPPRWKQCLTQLSLVLLDLQRARRLLRFSLKGLAEEFSKELENEGCDGWSPDEFPDWLLIQLQGNFLIRRAQAETAMEIISPQSGKNAVMQVNMGDGKSSVIIPIAAAALANGEQLVRVIVPKALTAQMFDILVARLGGLTNRPIYHLPFSRNPEYDHKGRVNSLQIDDLHRFMSQCMAEGGVLLVQPEHVVSLKLMGVEEQIRAGELTTDLSTLQKSIYKHISGALLPRSEDHRVDSKFQLSAPSSKRSSNEAHTQPDGGRSGDAHNAPGNESKWLSLQKWLDSHVRDILDESDEILHPRFQLVYTMGPQQHMDGYPTRWTITQQVLALVKKHLYSLSRYAPDAIEYECDPPGSFPHVQILRASDIGQLLMSFIVEDVLDGKLPSLNFERVSPTLRDAIRSFISDENVLQVPATAKRVEKYAKESDQSHLWGGLLLLRGLLTSNIILWALTERRWRVNYGRTTQTYSGTDTTLAVPYRAKDMPARNTQFGHPDLTIILTCLSYYYEGLRPRELKECFEILLNQDDPTTEYTLWIQQCEPLPDSVPKLNDINLNPSEQWDKIIYPLFYKNQTAIDFYLSRVVFPKEATGFPWKISASSWDLAQKRKQLITGFSGTSDGRWLLPMSIAHHDLDHQKGTNASVLAWLLQPENGSYMVLRDNEKQRSTRTLLQRIAEQQPEIRVLLDIGSQILDLPNREVASAWLKISPGTAGAIYFNDMDELRVLTPNGNCLPMLSSSLSQHLERCVVYLDHAHTRGTDINLPVGSRAAVTLGPKVTKDALVQGCMRMRKLGRGHSVMFFAPLEVDRIIRGVAGKTDPGTQVTTVDILSWAIRETWTDIQQRAPYWAQQGMNHKSTHDAWNQFLTGKLSQKKLVDAWLKPEMKSLANLYAPGETKKSTSSLPVLDPEILEHCKGLGVLALPKVELDEEQEREVCRERERERELEVPPMAEPAEHSLHPDVKSFVRTGLIPSRHSGKVFQPAFTLLGQSSAATRDADVWSRRILATADFSSTIKPESTRGTIDQYLRPVQWILTSKMEPEPVLVLLSPFEVNCLLPDIRTSEFVHLHLYAPRTAERMKPSDDLRLYSIPALPSDWTPPWDLIDQLNVFAGQLFLRDYESYTRLCHFLGVPSKDVPNNTAIRRNLFNIPGSFEEVEIMFSGSPLPSMMSLLAIRSRGRPFAHTHMGKILQGQVLTKKDFARPTGDRSVASQERPRMDAQ